jgi:ankyrin repeat protein
MATRHLLDAAAAGEHARVRALLEERPEAVNLASESGKTALHWAAFGADPTARTVWGMTPLDWAATLGSERVARVLIECEGADGLTLFSAAALGLIDETRRFFEPGGHVRPGSGRFRPDHPLDPSEWPPTSAYARGDAVSDAFYVAARNGRVEMAAFLLERGAHIDAEGYFGGTALHWASVGGHREMVDWLVARGASLEALDQRFKATPAEWANEGGHVGIETFLRSRANGDVDSDSSAAPPSDSTEGA